MSPPSPRRATVVAAIVLLTAFATACSLVLDTEKNQCATTGDCAKLGVGLTCVDGICVGSSNDGGGGDALADAACTPKEPKTSREQFLNEPCTDSTCIPFDNCAKVGVCDADTLPALVDPPDGGV